MKLFKHSCERRFLDFDFDDFVEAWRSCHPNQTDTAALLCFKILLDDIDLYELV
jgi:hypothetical protein